jgi:hypothetical protein
MTMTIPTMPSITAGYVVQETDLADLCYAATFLLTKPLTQVVAVSGQSITAAGAFVQWSSANYDTDGMWNASANTRLTCQTPGVYHMSYSVCNNGVTMNCAAQGLTGASNPLGSAIVVGPHWASATYGDAASSAAACGVWPAYMYAGDYIEIFALPNSTMIVEATSVVPVFTMELVST